MKEKYVSALCGRLVLCLAAALAVVASAQAGESPDGSGPQVRIEFPPFQFKADRDALRQLDADLDGEGTLNWDTANDGDTWNGVNWQSVPSHARVTRIDVSGKGLANSSNAWGTLTELTWLNVMDNKLIALDLSGNTNLNTLIANNNELTNINLTGVTGLTYVNVPNNKLATLDLSGNTNLNTLFVYNNELTDIDLSGVTGLTSVDVYNNKLTTLDLSGNTNLNTLFAYNNELTDIDLSGVTGLTSIEVYDNKLTALDLSGNSNLNTLFAYNNELTDIDLSGVTGLTSVNVSVNKLTTLDLSGNTNLTTLFAYNNELTDIDLSGVSGLTSVNVSDNKFTALDLSGNTNLNTLDASNNELTDIDLSGVTGLTSVSVSDNKLTTLDLSGNTNLNALYANNNELTDIDLTGLTGLSYVEVSDNKLTTLDLSGNSNLNMITAANNELTDIDLTGVTGLTSVIVSDNKLTALDLSGNSNLIMLYAFNNELADIGLSGLTELTIVSISNNKLTALDLSDNIKVTQLYASGNRLSSVSTIAGNAAIQEVNVHDNALPLSELYSLMGKDSVYLGQQNDVAFAVFGGTLATGRTYDVGMNERIIGGVETAFTVRQQDGGGAIEDIHYSIDNGVITFLIPGDYVVTMQNDNVYSKGQIDNLDENLTWHSFDFETADNPSGEAHPLAVVTTGRVSVLGDDLSTRLLVRVEEAGASVNACRFASGLDRAVFVDGVRLTGELEQIYSAARGASGDAELLHIVNQGHLESVAGGMDAVLSAAARPFISRLFGRAAVRPEPDGTDFAAAYSWTAHAQLTGSSSPGGTSGLDASAAGVGHFAHMSGHDAYLGYDLQNYGGFVSLGKAFGEARVGFALGYSHTTVEWDDYGNETKSDSFSAGLYASRFFDNLAVTWQANFGYADTSHTRNIPAAGVTATGDYDMYWFGTGLEAAYRFDLGNCLTLTPSLGLDYLHSRSGSFTEKGAGTAGARVSSQNRDSLEGRFGVTLAKSFVAGTSRITPSLSLGGAYAMADCQTTVDYRFASAAPQLPAFRAESAKMDRLRFTVGAGIDVAVNDRVSVEAVYQGDFQSDYNSHYFRVGVGLSF